MDANPCSHELQAVRHHQSRKGTLLNRTVVLPSTMQVDRLVAIALTVLVAMGVIENWRAFGR